MKNDKSVSKLQYAALAFSMPLVFKVAMLPSLLASEAGRDAWLSVAVLVLLELCELAVVVRISMDGGWQAAKEAMPKWLLIVISILLFGVILLKLTIFASEIANYAVAHMFYDISTFSVVVIFMITVAYIALKGDRALGRLAESAMWFVPLVFLVGFAFGEMRLRPDNLLPIGTIGASGIFGSADKYLFWSCNFTPLLFLKLDKKQRLPVIPVAGFGSCLAVIAIFVVFVASFGAAAPLMDNAFARLASFNVVSSEIGSIDWPAIIVWLIMCVLALSSMAMAAAKIGSGFGLPRWLGAVVVAAASGALLLTVFKNIQQTLSFALSNARYPIVFLEFSIPLLLLVLMRKRKAPHHEQET